MLYHLENLLKRHGRCCLPAACGPAPA
jgi:hypothetical protein